MNPNGPIVLIEDDADEAEILCELFNRICPANEVIVINDSRKAVQALSNCEKPFIIFSSVNLSALNGFQLRNEILADTLLSRKCSPYIFYAASSNEEMLKRVYDAQASGYFHDITDYNELGDRLASIVEYWGRCAV
jgi:CheY-like chemotaxis protein